MDKLPLINIFHILIVSPTLYYVANKKGNVNANIKLYLQITAAIIVLYHLFLVNQKGMYNNASILNWFHILFVAPLLFIIGKYGANMNTKYSYALMILSIFVGVFHAYKTYTKMM